MPETAPPGHDPTLCVTPSEHQRVLRDIWTVLMRDGGLSPQTRRHLALAYYAALDPRLAPKIRRALYGCSAPPQQRSEP